MSTLGFLLLITEAFQMAAGGSEVAPPAPAARPLPSTVRVVRDVSGPDALSAPIYTVECKISATKGMTFSLPRLTLRDGAKVMISDTDQRTFLVATRTENGAAVPVQESITEGTTAVVVVRGLGEDRVLLDISLDLRFAAGSTELPGPVQVQVVSGRAMKSVQLGEMLTAEFDAQMWKIEAVVTRALESAKIAAPEKKPD